jgi:hypothetical protein
LLMATIASAANKGRGSTKGVKRLDIQVRTGDSKEPAERPGDHPVPRMPFVLRGTLYDPQDIRRFNGEELHTIAAPGRDYMLIIDDRGLMDNWWQLRQMSTFADAPNKVLGVQTGVGPGGVDIDRVAPTNIGGPVIIVGDGGSSDDQIPHTNLWEDANQQGDRLRINVGNAVPRLGYLSHGFLGTQDWNDTVSSVQIVWSMGGVTLFEPSSIRAAA